MTRKDYVMISTILRLSRAPHNDTATLEELAYSFAENLAVDNPRFDRARFLVACGVN
jgi:hypothetical protein